MKLCFFTSNIKLNIYLTLWWHIKIEKRLYKCKINANDHARKFQAHNQIIQLQIISVIICILNTNYLYLKHQCPYLRTPGYYVH